MALKSHVYFTYILTNKNNTVLYTGMTNDLAVRCRQHQEKRVVGFTKRYNVDRLVYYEVFRYVQESIRREKQIKGYSRAKKVALINNCNPTWEALYVNGRVKRIES
ncbi:MAG: GIY-YIG nuclease family protein [Cryomorphaceae bacterium]|nr:GIY-YIG nuclease family protein [Flavobacteriales bacterium]